MFLALLVWMIALVVVWLFAAGPSWFPRGWFPPPISGHARSFDDNFTLTLWLTGAIFLAAHAALGWVIYRYRRAAGQVSGTEGNHKLEVLWTIAATVLFVGVAALSTRIWAGVHMDKAPDDALRIEALGKQFAFSFRYPGRDGRFGRIDVKQINDASGNPFGIDEADPVGRDDISTAALRVPAGRPVVLMLRSRDVIHNFFVRELRLKQDLVPGMEIPLPFTAEKAGEYEVACSELCGLGHHQMKTMLIVLRPAEFEAWLNQMHAQIQAQYQIQPEVR
jgi:cytochrome c oxidase subunit 2